MLSRKKKIQIGNLIPKSLILAVKSHPCIWNSSCPEYRNTVMKHEAWYSVVSEVIDTWSEFNYREKQITHRIVVRRWNNIRDYYNKMLKAAHRARLDGRPWKRKKYMYEDELEFLRAELEKNIALNINEAKSSPALKVEMDEEDSKDIEEYITFAEPLDDHEESSHNGEYELLEYDEEDNKSAKEDDPDLMFLKSLLPDMKKLEDNEKFQFKFAIMQAFMSILKKRLPINNNSLTVS